MADVRVVEVVAPNPGPLTLDGTRTYVIGDDACAVIDPGPALAGHLDSVEVSVGGRRVAAVCLTHWHPDHAGGGSELRARLGAPLAATAQTAELADLEPPEIELRDGTEIELGGGRLRSIAAPGHSPDHVCFFWPDAGALFSGDAILGEGTSMIAPPEGDMAAYMRTLERLARLELAVIYPGHGPRIERAREKIEEYISHRRERESQVLQALRGGAVTPESIRAEVYPDLEPGLEWAAEGSVRAHLRKLTDEGRVAEIDGRFALAG